MIIHTKQLNGSWMAFAVITQDETSLQYSEYGKTEIEAIGKLIVYLSDMGFITLIRE